jgi:hypothetical protein
VPVRGVDDAHKYSLAKKHRRIIYLSSRRLPFNASRIDCYSLSLFKIRYHMTVIFFINLSQN